MTEEKRTPDEDLVTLEYDDGTSMECEIMGVFPCGEKDYIALIPHNGTDDVYIYAYQEYDDGSYEINDIESDQEFRKAVKEFDNIMIENAEIEEER